MPLIAVDIGNSRTKFGIFADGRETVFPNSIEDVAGILRSFDEPLHWATARSGGEHLQRNIEKFIAQNRPQDTLEELSYKNVPLKINTDEPAKTGIDRLLAAYAAVRFPTQGQKRSSALLVDAGSAVTIDLVSSDGVFEGGAILPGLSVAAKSLTDISPKLPLLDRKTVIPGFPAYPGKNTEAAIRAGLLLQIIGAVCLCYRKISSAHGEKILLFLTGGDADVLRCGLEEALPEAHLILVPDLVLRGISLIIPPASGGVE